MRQNTIHKSLLSLHQASLICFCLLLSCVPVSTDLTSQPQPSPDLSPSQQLPGMPSPSSRPQQKPTPAPQISPSATPSTFFDQGLVFQAQEQISPALSPDGRFLIFVSRLYEHTSFGGGRPGYSDRVTAAYYLMNLQTGRSTLIYRLNGNQPHGWYLFDFLGNKVEWSQDSSRALLFEDASVYLFQLQNQQLTRLATQSKSIDFPSWSSSGHDLLKPVIDTNRQTLQAEVEDESGNSQGKIGPLKYAEATPQNLVWLKKTKQVLTLQPYTYDALSQTTRPMSLKRLGPAPEDKATLWSWSETEKSDINYLTVSPDEKYAAFVLRRKYHYGADSVYTSPQSTLYLVNLTKSEVHPAYTGYMLHGAMNWSPDSRFLAFSAKRTDNNTEEIFGLEMSDVGPERLHQLTETQGRDNISNRFPLWSANNKEILFSSNGYFEPPIHASIITDLYRMEISTRKPKRLTCSHAEAISYYNEYLDRTSFELPDWQCP